MKQTPMQVLLTAVLILFLLAACAPAPVETPDLQEIENQVATSVALTVASQNLETASAVPPATETPLPTATQVPVDTPTAVPPMDTATPLPLPTSGSSGGGGGGTTVQAEYSCNAINRRPYDNTVFKPGAKFDIKWTIVNDGTRTLRAGLDLKFSNGDKLMPDKVVELPELKPGAEFQVNFDGTAPSKEGSYVMAYIVEGGLCYPYTAIVVQK